MTYAHSVFVVLGYQMLVTAKKRSRTNTGSSNSARRGRAIAAAINSRYPLSDFGRAYMRRGTAQNLEDFGATFADADEAQRDRRKRFGYYGRGMYDRQYRGSGSYVGKALKFAKRHHLGDRAVAAMGKYGGAYGALGASAYKRGKSLYMGRGSYTNTNSLINGSTGLDAPSFKSYNDETKAIAITHVEYIKDIFGNEWDSTPSIINPFVVQTFEINPANSQVFPWLSQLACNYEEYEIKQLMFSFKTRVGTNLQTQDGQIGTVTMHTDYRVEDKPKLLKNEVLAAYGSVSGEIDSAIQHGIECDTSKIKGDGHKYIRVGGVANDDTDWGRFQLGVDNTPQSLSNKVIGELYVSYTVVLRKPRIFASLGGAIATDKHKIRIAVDKTADEDIEVDNVSSVVFSDKLNSIGCLVQSAFFPSTVSATNAFFRVRHIIVVPASFQGPFELLITRTAPAVGSNEYPRTKETLVETGTDSKIDIVSQDGAYAPELVGSATQEFVHNACIRVKCVANPVVRGDNTIVVTELINVATSSTEDQMTTEFEVRRYNTNDGNSSEFVSSDGSSY